MRQRLGSRHVTVVVGTRPEIVKLSPLICKLGTSCELVHAGQHVDDELSGSFLAAAGLVQARTLTGVCGQARHLQFARILEQLGAAFAADRPAAVIVHGDTNTASAAAQAANYAGIPLIHVEAGLRSDDRAMPEEINRRVTGVLADLHCAPTQRAVANLRGEGVPAGKIRLTGNTIVEATLGVLPDEASARESARQAGVEPGQYVLATIHRPENTDDPARLEVILGELGRLGLPVLFPLHPRTRQAIGEHGLAAAADRLRVIPPVSHRTFLALATLARLLVSDSGGVQEECTIIKRPLVIVRNSTERPESIESGFAWLVAPGPMIGDTARNLIADQRLSERLARIPCPFGDGLASDRIADAARYFLRGDESAIRGYEGTAEAAPGPATGGVRGVAPVCA